MPAALRRLRDHSFRLFTLTTTRWPSPVGNWSTPVATALGIEPGGICLIASHVWDTIGALAAD